MSSSEGHVKAKVCRVTHGGCCGAPGNTRSDSNPRNLEKGVEQIPHKGLEKELALLTPWLHTSRLKNHERKKFQSFEAEFMLICYNSPRKQIQKARSTRWQRNIRLNICTILSFTNRRQFLYFSKVTTYKFICKWTIRYHVSMMEEGKRKV